MLGHETVLRAAVTERHYLEAHQVDSLRPAAKQLDATLAGAVLTARWCDTPATRSVPALD